MSEVLVWLEQYFGRIYRSRRMAAIEVQKARVMDIDGARLYEMEEAEWKDLFGDEVGHDLFVEIGAAKAWLVSSLFPFPLPFSRTFFLLSLFFPP